MINENIVTYQISVTTYLISIHHRALTAAEVTFLRGIILQPFEEDVEKRYNLPGDTHLYKD